MERKHTESAKSRHNPFSIVMAQPEQTSRLKIFVYGTLKPGQVNYQAFCSDKVISAHVAIAQGQLFSLPAGYPAMTLEEGQVHGFVLLFKDDATLSQLDDYEDYQVGRSPQHNLYERCLIETFAPTGQSLGSAWAYLMSLPRVYQMGGTRLSSGAW